MYIRDQIKRFTAARQAEGAANGSINRELAFLKRAYNLGIEAEMIVRKPNIPQLKENNVNVRKVFSICRVCRGA